MTRVSHPIKNASFIQPEAKRLPHLPLAVLLASFLLLATIYNVVSTPFEAPDEIGHFYYVVHLLQQHRLPVVPAESPPPHYEHEGAQPPLYYVSTALFIRTLAAPLGLNLEDADAPLETNPHSTCGKPGVRYNVAYLAHDPHRERLPYQGRVRVLHVARLWSSLLGMATVAGVFAVTRLAFPDAPQAAWLAAGLTAFTPEFLFTAGAVSNDNLVTALATWGIYVALHTLRDGPRWPLTLALGLISGLAALSKLSGALLLPLFLLIIPLAVMLHPVRREAKRLHPIGREAKRLYGRDSSKGSFPYLLTDTLRAIVGHCMLVVLLFLALAGWWFFRNWTLYGDPSGTRPILDALSLRQEMSIGTLIRELPGLFRSWWGVFGCTVPPTGVYLPYLALMLGGLGGLIADRHRLRREWPQVATLLTWLVLLGVSYTRWNWAIHAAKGRLLYPAMASVAGLIGRGWTHWTDRRRWLSPALLTLLALGAAGMPPFMMAPPVEPPAIYPAATDIHPQHQLDGRFGPDIALLGYDLRDTSLEPEEELDLTLYWQALGQPAANYTLAIQLVSAVPAETDLLINFNTWTGGGNYPTGLWHPGDVIADRYRLQLPDDVPRAQGWLLQIALFDLNDGVRLPVTLEETPIDGAVTLNTLRVGASNPEAMAPSKAERLASQCVSADGPCSYPIDFAGGVALDGARVTKKAQALDVILWWRSTAPLANDPVVFVHLYDSAGQLIATADGPPLAGGFPVSLWQPGDRVRDQHSIPLPEEGERPSQVGVGWYDPATGARLAATTADGVRLPNDVVLVPLPSDVRYPPTP